MSTYERLQLGFALTCAVLNGVLIYIRGRREDRNGRPWLGSRRYGPLIGWTLLPTYVTVWLLLPLAGDRELYLTKNLPVTLMILMELTVYDGVLLLLTPLLRRRLRATTCAGLWLLPNVIYIFTNANFPPPRRLFLLTVPRPLAPALYGIWAAGFALVLLWKIGGHLWMRGRLRRSREPVEDSVRALWEEECAAMGEEKVTELYRSPLVKTPMTVGLFEDLSFVLLPERAYTEAELRLIFRHELVHIQRQDAGLKFFMAFMAALCWFNPLVWLAMRRAAEDTELGCDETVLRGANPEQRRDYGRLLLSAVGEARGFTTCLSATARSLGYRLKSLMEPGRRRRGALLSALVMFLLLMGYGLMGTAVEAGSLGEHCALQPGQLQSVNRCFAGERNGQLPVPDAEAVTAALEALPLAVNPGGRPGDDVRQGHEGLCFVYASGDGRDTVSVTVSDWDVYILHRREEGVRGESYLLCDTADWEALKGLLEG